MNILELSIRNLKRKPFRSITLILSVALVSTLVFAGSISAKSVLTSIIIGAQRLGADLIVVPQGYEDNARTTLIAGSPSVFYMPSEVLNKVRSIKGVKRASPQLFIKSSEFECCTFVNVLLVAFDPETDFTITSWLEKKTNTPLGADEVIIGRSVPVSIGEKMTFFGKTLTVKNYFASTGLEFIDKGVYMTIDTARDMIRKSKTQAKESLNIDEDAISTILVQLEPNITPERGAVFVEYEVKGIKAIPAQEVISSVKKQLYLLLKAIFGGAIALWLTVLILIGIVFSMIVNERQKEIGLLRSMGAKRSFVFSMILSESIIISSVGAVLGIVIGGSALIIWKESLKVTFGLPYIIPNTLFVSEMIAITILAITASGGLAALLPSAKSSMIQPYDAVRRGE